jgi:CP family cyanate transporter-like MFS transporter
LSSFAYSGFFWVERKHNSLKESPFVKNKFDFLFFIGIIFVTANLRAAITAVGPLIAIMKTDLPFSNGVLGLLTTIPLIMFASLSPFVRALSDKLGAGKTLILSLSSIALGILLRSYAGGAGLFIGTVLLGAGAAIGNVLIPGVIKARFPGRIGLATGAFTVSMTSFAAISAAVSYPLASLPGVGWRNALAVWFALALFGFLLWMPHRKLRITSNTEESEKPQTSVWRSGTAWALTVLMGAQSFLFYFFTAWLPSIAQSKGISPTMAGYVAFAFQLSTIPAAFIISAIAVRLKNQRGLISIVAAAYFASLVAVFVLRSFVPLIIAVLMYGLSTGACFNLCILLLSLRTHSAERATSLSGMVQSIGYTLGATGPILGGWLFDQTGSWTAAFACAAAMMIVIFFSGRVAGRNRMI